MTIRSPIFAALALAAFGAAAAPAAAAPDHEARQRYYAHTVETGGDPVYCIRQERVDTRIPERICMTKRGWVQAGAQVIDGSEAAYAAVDDRHSARGR